MDEEHLNVLREALEMRQRKEELERAIGRAARKRDMAFQDYVQIMAELREMANREGITPEDAAKRLLGQ